MEFVGSSNCVGALGVLQQLPCYPLGRSGDLLACRWVSGCDQAHQVESVEPFLTIGRRATGANLPECADGVAFEWAQARFQFVPI